MASAPRFVPAPAPSVLALKTIIFATDFSDCSENASQYAAFIARQFGAELLVAHTFVPTQAAMEVEAERPGASVQRVELQAALEHEAKRLGAGLRSSRAVLLEGDPPRQIPQLARRQESALIVLGTQGRGNLGRALLGATAEKILRSTCSPTLTVGRHVPPCCEGQPPFHRVLYATGLSPAAARGAAYAIGMAQAFHAEMEVMHVVHPEDGEDVGRLAQVRERFAAEVAAMVPHHAGAMSAPRSVIATGTAHTRILEHIRENAIDLLVLSLHKSSHLWLESRLSGAFHIIAAATCPVLTVIG